MTKGTVILMGGIWAMLAGQSAFALASAAPASARSPMGEALVGMTCPCVLDQDGDDFINLVDLVNVIDCSYGFEPQYPMTCDTADINCDGVIDLCDASRVWCGFHGMTDCCANTACGACCNIAGGIFEPCVEVSESLCLSVVLEEGDYLGDGTVCDPWPCDAFECTTNDDCHDENPCTEDVCIESHCFHETMPNWTPCPDELFCNGDETCQQGVCLVVSPRTCDDALACTTDTCNEAEDTCVHTPAACNNDGVCDSPCENADNCPADCDECPCVLDQDGNGFIQITDVLNVIECADGEPPIPPMTCDFADLNCDGEVDYCDASRVFCAFMGHPNCCEAEIVCGACCNSGLNFGPCLVVSEAFCYSLLIDEGDYLGDGTVCDPWPCDAVECTTHADCNDENVCTDDACVGGDCVHENLPNGTGCPDSLFCNGDETCQQGACESGPPRSCDDALTCTTDTCNEAEDVCVHTPAECNNDGVCDSPCENTDNCPADCADCPCVLDQDGDGLIKIQDVLNVVTCADGETPTPPLTCDDADLNCDGVVDYCDVSRVYCGFVNHPDCCGAEIVCGACCNSGLNFDPCLVVSEEFCYSVLISEGDYLGDGTVCDPWPCDAVECTTHADCDDENVCTEDACIEGDCVHEDLPNWTPCPDELFCNGDETCQWGVCHQGSPRTCDDGLSCTTDSCNEVEDTCVHVPDECNNDGTCDSPCENADNCPGDCTECLCLLDQDGNGFIQITDVLNVVVCAEGDAPNPPLTCNDADLNCDGEIDYCDVSRVFCAFMGYPNCCEAEIVCGACCSTGANFRPCLVGSEEFCYSALVDEGDYLGDGTVCDPWPCETTPCSTDADCNDENVCTTDICTYGGICENTPVPNGTPCSDELFCNGDETCHLGACESGPPRSCDDLNPCTIDACDEAEDTCVHTPIECNHDGVCDAPCENADNCMDDCSTCTAIRDLSDGSMAYCPEVLKTIHITLDVPSGALTAAVEDVPPTGWTQISNISDDGEYDTENHKVKWGPLFDPFPSELTYDIVPPAEAVGMVCFTGSVAIDNEPGEPICGDECIEDSCCPAHPADEPQPICEGCSDDCPATAGDGRAELCEVIRYACAWKRGCNDDLTGVTGGAYIWMVGECYCWDEVEKRWVPESCGQSPSGCCEGGGEVLVGTAAGTTGTATVTYDSIRRGYDDAARGLEISVSINPPTGTSAAALGLQIPKGWAVRIASDGGEWDRLHGKVKWGPFFGDLPRTVTVTVNRTLRRVQEQDFTGTVSFDGKNYPITATTKTTPSRTVE